MNIYIYKAHAGEGGSSFSAIYLSRILNQALQNHGYKIDFVTSEDIKSGEIFSSQDCKMFVMGGGRFSQVKEAIGTQGIENIKAYVQNGGTYLGVCMGAYAAFSKIDFRGEFARTSEGFSFFQGTSRGSLPLTLPYDATGNSATIIEVQHAKRAIKFPALYWGGNGMDKNELIAIGAEPLSHIKLANGAEKVMSASINVGNNGGKAYLCGYHPEGYSWRNIWEWLTGLSPDSACYTRLYYELMQHPDKAYLMSMACLLDDIGIVENHSFIRQVNKDMAEPSSAQRPLLTEDVLPYIK